MGGLFHQKFMMQNFLHTRDIFDQNLLERRWRGVKGHLKLVHKLIRFVGGGLPLEGDAIWSAPKKRDSTEMWNISSYDAVIKNSM